MSPKTQTHLHADMYLNPDWTILTVGDGDLSFSNALYRHIKPKKLVASTYDDQ